MLDYSAVVSRTGPTRNGVSIVGGPDQIRTGVEAFAELCLATRLQDHKNHEKERIGTMH